MDFETHLYKVTHDLRAHLRHVDGLTAWIKEDLDKMPKPWPGDIAQNFDLLAGVVAAFEKDFAALEKLSSGEFELPAKPSEQEVN